MCVAGMCRSGDEPGWVKVRVRRKEGSEERERREPKVASEARERERRDGWCGDGVRVLTREMTRGRDCCRRGG